MTIPNVPVAGDHDAARRLRAAARIAKGEIPKSRIEGPTLALYRVALGVEAQTLAECWVKADGATGVSRQYISKVERTGLIPAKASEYIANVRRVAA